MILSRRRCAARGRWQIAFDGSKGFTSKLGAQFVVGMAANQARRFSSGLRPAR